MQAALFFVMYVFATSIIMMNVAIAILVDNFLSGASEANASDKKEKATE